MKFLWLASGEGNLRGCHLALRNGFQCLQPSMQFRPQMGKCNPTKSLRIPIEAEQGLAHHRLGTASVATLKVVKGPGDLDQGLEKSFLRLGGQQPDGFPMFMGFEELAGTVATQPRFQLSRRPIEGHA